MRVKTYEWNVLDYLKTEEDYAHYLNAAIEEGGNRPAANGYWRHRAR
ncbi:MAG: hypothetical protein V8T51_03060 [Senegalimassilia faecalis]